MLAAVAVGVGIGWAARTVFTPPRDVLASTAVAYVTVTRGEVGSSISLNTVARWAPSPVGTNKAAGTVTSVDVQPGATVKAGTVLYTVNLRPVVIAAGDVPAFRAMEVGTKGRDVGQLQDLLADLGLYHGAADGDFRAGTVSAVEAWQRQLGVPADGVVQAGDLVFVPTLPARVVLDASIRRGSSLAGGEPVVQSLGRAPSFTMPVGETQASLMPTGTTVDVKAPDGSTWHARVGAQVTGADGQVTATLKGAAGAVVCGRDCDAVPVGGESLLASQVVTVPTTRGLVVPSAALTSSAGGRVMVIDRTGARHPVDVKATAQGMSVIEGVPDGTQVRVPAQG